MTILTSRKPFRIFGMTVAPLRNHPFRTGTRSFGSLNQIDILPPDIDCSGKLNDSENPIISRAKPTRKNPLSFQASSRILAPL